ncbi:hypothetical protein A1OO_04620 [Enterovibrio norvegicus FF-33]|uniref:Uncharacterized protein n=1 Tax=Enterovibrio norvegicus FF-454 TaxID=1185651 RepID=A0A1E5CB66_9GAMM|nr:hypothetical protein [Enterovibrio norvegicus]OEE62764.1 hypothetical protein A1OK_19440 [Enterovibrio norvegicus FF-454]OEE70063.1 hypothetical protein A1OO_04620 [Enterovibrio norvegicus FF-33]
MGNAALLPEEMKLNVICRLEPGCLGPQGASKIDDFCQYIEQDMQALNSDSVTLNVVPRNDKSLPEIQFTVMGKMMSRSQAAKYLERLDQSLDDFEALFEGKLETLIDKYMGY